jgi:hypothetical protein
VALAAEAVGAEAVAVAVVEVVIWLREAVMFGAEEEVEAVCVCFSCAFQRFLYHTGIR